MIGNQQHCHHDCRFIWTPLSLDICLNRFLIKVANTFDSVIFNNIMLIYCHKKGLYNKDITLKIGWHHQFWNLLIIRIDYAFLYWTKIIRQFIQTLRLIP